MALIQLRVYHNNSSSTKCIYISTNIYVEPKHWDRQRQEVIHHPNQSRYNIRLGKMLADYRQLVFDTINRKEICTLEDIRPSKSKKKLDFYAFYEEQLQDKGKKISTLKVQKQTLNSLKRFKPSLAFEELNYKFIKDFDNYLHEIGNKKTTIAKHHKHLKTKIKEAIRLEVIEELDNPYRKFKYDQGKHEESVFLTYQEIKRIKNLKLDPVQDKKLIPVRDMFLLSFYTGNRFGDTSKFNCSNVTIEDGHYILSSKVEKTDKYHVMHLKYLFVDPSNSLSRPEQIIKHYYDFHSQVLEEDDTQPFFGFTNQHANRCLKELAIRAQISKKIGTHTARHSFGTYMVDKVEIHLLQKLMNHSSLKDTMKYVHLSRSSINKT